jgi:hypothetical protein
MIIQENQKVQVHSLLFSVSKDVIVIETESKMYSINPSQVLYAKYDQESSTIYIHLRQVTLGIKLDKDEKVQEISERWW